jgi:NADPH-dependent ferric siderophore reductase
MTVDEPGASSARLRREPPTFRRATIRRRQLLTPRLVRVTLAGPELAGLRIDEPAASVRVLLPSPGDDDLVLPKWNGNEFLRADGTRPPIRTLTPRRLDPEQLELDVDVVLHGDGAVSTWAADADPGSPVAISGPGRGYAIDADEATTYLLAGDETAIAAISVLLEALPAASSVDVLVEVADPAARLSLPEHPAATVEWLDLPADAPAGDALFTAITARDLAPGTRVWVAGEAAGVQRIRRYLFEERGWSRREATVRGYWKYGRRGDG